MLDVLHLIHNPKARTLVVLGYPDVFCAGDHVPTVLAFKPIGLEGMDDRLIDDMIKTRIHPDSVKMLPEGRGWLLVEFGGETQTESNARAREFMDAIAAGPAAPAMRMFDDVRQQHLAWKARESGLPATAHVPGQAPTWEGFEDSAVAPARIGNYLRDLRKLFARHGYTGALYGHFGEGASTRASISTRITDGIANYRRSWMKPPTSSCSTAARCPASTATASRARKSRRRCSARARRRVPGVQSDLGSGLEDESRQGCRSLPHSTKTCGSAPATIRRSRRRTSLSRRTRQSRARDAALRRRRRVPAQSGGTMCPSYWSTREEAHSTRGRAHMLFEMLKGETITRRLARRAREGGARSLPRLQGLPGRMPGEVDMATYKAEFLSHYYEGRPRPRRCTRWASCTGGRGSRRTRPAW